MRCSAPQQNAMALSMRLKRQSILAICVCFVKKYMCDHYGLILPYTSFYRNKEVNKRVGGSSTKSQHMLGQAMDICPRGLNGLTNAKLFKYIKENLPFDQLIWEFGNSTEPGWVHVSYSVLHRRQVLKAYKVNNTTKYDPYD
jgi:zinc D-Ala-D-Ala carboxypeptidase